VSCGVRQLYSKHALRHQKIQLIDDKLDLNQCALHGHLFLSAKGVLEIAKFRGIPRTPLAMCFGEGNDTTELVASIASSIKNHFVSLEMVVGKK
jgi:hypothetical protein